MFPGQLAMFGDSARDTIGPPAKTGGPQLWIEGAPGLEGVLAGGQVDRVH
jgi:hypothetical protein